MTTATALRPRGIAVMPAAVARRAELPRPCSVVSFGDPGDGPAPFGDAARVARRLHLEFHDCAADVPWAVRPTSADAARLLEFVDADETGLVVCQCQAGVARSVATAAALHRLSGRDDRAVRCQGKYHREWYALLLRAGGMGPEAEPLVSLAVRVKYPADRLHALLLSLRRQRHETWEAVVVTDGPDADAAEMVAGMTDPRVRLVETPEKKGRWGHPWRQLGLEACRGAYVGMANDDDYYAPGYLEQMVRALEWGPADLALCDMVHAYHGWAPCRAHAAGGDVSADVGNWVARAELVRRVPWAGCEFDSDREYVGRLAAAGRVAVVRRPLHVKN